MTGEYIFFDCSKESPKGRRSVCYDREALESRKKHKPENNAMDMANAIGIEMLTEEQYRELQELDNFDMKRRAGCRHLLTLENLVERCFVIDATRQFLSIIMVQIPIMVPEVFAVL